MPASPEGDAPKRIASVVEHRSVAEKEERMTESLSRAFVLDPGAGTALWTLGGRFTVKLGEGPSEGRLAVLEALAYRSTEPPLHIHHHEDEAWYILDGQMTFYIGDDSHVVTTGGFVFAPRGLPHTFTVEVEPTKVLVFVAPAGFDRFAVELGVPAASSSDTSLPDLPPPDILAPIAQRFGIEVVGPPRRISEAARS